MLTVALPDAAELRSNTTFEALMWALSRPGEVRELPEPGLVPLVEALIDIECTAYGDTAALRQSIIEAGAQVAEEMGTADHLFLERLPDDLVPLSFINCGSAFYPDDGATVVIGAPVGEGQRLRLSGPGIDGVREISVALPEGFWRLREGLCLYPEGFELFVVEARAVIGIPRSTKVEVL